MDSFGNNDSYKTLYFDTPAMLNVGIVSVESRSSSVSQNFRISSKSNMTDGYQEFLLYTELAGRYLVDVGDNTSSVVGSPLSLNFISG